MTTTTDRAFPTLVPVPGGDHRLNASPPRPAPAERLFPGTKVEVELYDVQLLLDYFAELAATAVAGPVPDSTIHRLTLAADNWYAESYDQRSHGTSDRA